jgi:NDP-sugar pyrophosphorylase family protein
MKAMIFAAGLGTRMRPATDNLPKALIPIDGVPLLEIIIRQLKCFDIKDIIINIHYLADQIEAFFADNQNFDINIQISDERSLLLETGGALQKASWFFDDEQPFLVCNTDILSNIDLSQFLEQHKKNASIATLAVQNRKSSRYLLFNNENQLCGWMNTGQCKVKLSRLADKELKMRAFSAFQIIHPSIFKYFPEKQSVFSIIDTYLLASEHNLISAFDHSADQWIDVGTPEKISAAVSVLRSINIG